MSYTFSQCMSDNTGYYGAWVNARVHCILAERLRFQIGTGAMLLRRNPRRSAYAIYELPFGKGKRFGGDNKVGTRSSEAGGG